MRKTLPKLMALLLCLALLWQQAPGQKASAAGGDGVVTYRALLIGNAAYDGGQSLRAPQYDAAHMEQLLLQQDFDGASFAPEHILKLMNATKLAMLETIRRELASQADGDDVTYFYYSGHGTFDGNTSYLVGVELALLSIEELKAALDMVPGHKVVLLDCCYSGGFAGRSAGSVPIAGPNVKNPDGAKKQGGAASQADEIRQFQSAVMQPFEQKQAERQALASSGYKVLSAAAPFQYSYEYRFSAAGGAGYGPLFRMNGVDYAGGTGNYSGEFTGMLVAGAGRVSFNDVFPEVRALADVDRDRQVTMAELYRYLRGAVLYSTVQAYPEHDNTVLFRHSEAGAPDWGTPVLCVSANSSAHAPALNEPVRLDLMCDSGWQTTVSLRRVRLLGDNRTADNAGYEIRTVATLSLDGPVPDGSEATLLWYGEDQDGMDAGDGWYYATLRGGSLQYPPVPFELRRGVSNFPGAEQLPVNTTFSAAVPGDGHLVYSYTPTADGLLQLESVNGTDEQNPEAELYDADGNSLAWNDDAADPDRNFRLLRCLKAGQQYYIAISLNSGGGVRLSILARFLTPQANNALVAADTSRMSYAVIRPDVSGQWTIMAKAAYEDGASGITLYDAWFNPVAWGERAYDSYRSARVYLEAGRLYILETPKIPLSMQVAAYGPGKQPVPNVSAAPVLPSGTGAAVRIGHGRETQYFRVQPQASGIYRFYATAPREGTAKVDSYAFLLDAAGAALASDEDVDFDGGQVQFDFETPLTAGKTYVLAVRAHVYAGQLSSANPTLDFTVYGTLAGQSRQSAAVSAIAPSDKAVVALCDDDGVLANGSGAGGKLLGWGSSVDAEHDGTTGFDFGEGLQAIRRWTPQLLYVPGGASLTGLWTVGHGFIARGSGGALYAWGISTEDADYGVIRRLDSPANGLASRNVLYMAQGSGQNWLYLLDGNSGRIYRMEGLAGIPGEEPAPAGAYSKIAVTSGSLFALDDGGSLVAKGSNRYGECGNGGTSAVSTLTAVSMPRPVMDFAAGENHVLALDDRGDVYAWGSNDYGSLGLGSLDRIGSSPAQVSLDGLLSPGETVVRVFAGGNCSAAITSFGRVLAWGANDFGQLGVGSTFSKGTPAAVGALDPAELGAGRQAIEIVFGPESAYAILNDGSVLVCGRNEYGQLGFVSNSVRVFTPLTQPDLRSSNNSLLSIKLSAGALSPSFNPETFEYTVKMPEGVALSTVEAIKADATAALTIDGQSISEKIINAGPGPVRVVIEVTAQDGTTRSYVLNYPQSRSSNAALSSLQYSAGYLATPVNPTLSNYTILVPETVTAPIRLTPVLADPNASLTIDGMAAASKTVSPPGSGSVTVLVKVTAQTGNTCDYSFQIIRAPMLAGFSATPYYSGYPSIATGGSNRLTLRYSINCPCTVKIEVKKSGKWVALLNKAETSVGSKAFVWDGKAAGKYLPAGRYTVRITPYYAGKAGSQRTLTIRVLPKPRVTIIGVYPLPYRANGRNTLRIAFEWMGMTDVKAEIVTPSGKLVRSLYTQPNAPPGGKKFRWDGRNNQGKLVTPGAYRARITCGPIVRYQTITVKK